MEVLTSPRTNRNYCSDAGLVGYWLLIRRRKRTLVVTALAGLLAGFLSVVVQTKLYRSRAVLEIQGLNSDFMNMRAVDPNSPAPHYTASDVYVQTQVRILQSETLAERALSRMKANGRLVTSRQNVWRSTFRRVLRWAGQESTDPSVEIGRDLIKGLSVHSSAGIARIVEIQAESPSPSMSADFVNSLVAEYIDEDRDARSRGMQDTRQWLTQQMQQMRDQLRDSEDRLQAYARQTGLVFTSERNDISQEKLRLLQQDLSNAHVQRLSIASHLERANSSSPESLPDVLVDKTVRDARRKLIELKSELSGLTAHSKTVNDDRAVVIQSQIVSVESALEQQMRTILERIQRDNEEVQGRENLLEKAYRAQAKLVNDNLEKSVKYGMLKREVDTNRELYQGILQKAKEAAYASAMHPSNIHIVDPALIPEERYKPSLPQNVAVGLLAGILLGLMYVTTHEQAYRVLREPGDAFKYLDIRELGVIPSVPRQPRTSWLGLRSNNAAWQFLRKGTTGVTANHPELSSCYQHPSLRTEYVQSTISSMLYSGVGLDPCRVVTLTSSCSSDGATTAAINLATGCASSDRKVLLIDGNLHRTGISEIFGLTTKWGLTDLLLDYEAAEAHGDTIRGTSTKNLFVLPRGCQYYSNAILLHPERVRKILQDVRRNFDIVIVDAPALTPFADARVFGRMSDTVIFVARAGCTTLDALAAAKDKFAQDAIPVLGVILNDWDGAIPREGSPRSLDLKNEQLLVHSRS